MLLGIALSHRCTASLVVSCGLYLKFWRLRYNAPVKWQWRMMWNLYASLAQEIIKCLEIIGLVDEQQCQLAFMLMCLKTLICSTPSSLSLSLFFFFFSVINTVFIVASTDLKHQPIYLLVSDLEVKGSCFICGVRMRLCSGYASLPGGLYACHIRPVAV